MKYIWDCRRTFICLASLACLLTLGIVNEVDVSGAIAAVAMGLAAANAGEGAVKKFKKAATDDAQT